MAVHEGIVLPMGIVPPTVTGGTDPPMVIAGIVPPMGIREVGLPTEIAGIVLPMVTGAIVPATGEESGRPSEEEAVGVASVPVRRGVVFRLDRMESGVLGRREVRRAPVASPVVREVPVDRGRDALGSPAVALAVVREAHRPPRVPGVQVDGKHGIHRRLRSAVPAPVVPRTRWMTIAG